MCYTAVSVFSDAACANVCYRLVSIAQLTHLITLEVHFMLTKLLVAVLYISSLCLCYTIGRLWEVETGDCLQILEGHTDEIFSCAFNYEGDTIITGSKDNTCRIWKC
jgi:WD domain, G-beta repeat